MNEENAQVIYDLLDRIKVTDENRDRMEKIRKFLSESKFQEALDELQILQMSGNVEYEDYAEVKEKERKIKERKQEEGLGYPVELADTELEKRYIGLLLNDVKQISAYYFLYKDCLFLDEQLLDVYKTVLFTDGEKYAPEIAKEGFNFARTTDELIEFKYQIQVDYENSKFKMEKTYTELKKLFTLRRCCRENPVKHIQKEIADIRNYELYDKMTVEEVEGAVEQVTATEKFKRSVLNDDLTGFLVRGDNTLTNGLSIPFKILSSVFKGIRQGETMAFAMPSNSGKSRFTINLAAHIAFVEKKKVLIISNEMSEEKMKLCLITTILNNPEMQKEFGQKIRKSEGEILEFKFRPDDKKKVKVDKKGFMIKEEGETQENFIKRLRKYSTEFNQVIAATDWLGSQKNTPICFMHVSDYTNDDLYKIILNYYYKEGVEYVFYDTLKNDIQHIGDGEEIKKTATVLSNIAQKYKMFIGSTLQLLESTTAPINLTINDMAASRTVKEVLDTLCLFKQINNQSFADYEYSEIEEAKQYKDIEVYENPDVRYYACVVDKNRAGAKPKLLFRLNLAYNEWFELGHLRMKQKLK